MWTFGKDCVKFSSFKNSNIFSSVHVFWGSHCASFCLWPWGRTITVLKSSENWTNSEGKQSSKSLEYSSINLAAAPRMASLLSSVKFVRKPKFSWMSLYASNRCWRAEESLSMITRNTSTLNFCLGENTVSADGHSSNWHFIFFDRIEDLYTLSQRTCPFLYLHRNQIQYAVF